MAGRPVRHLVSAQACTVEALGGEGSGHGEAQVDKKVFRRKPSTSLAITVSRGPQHRKGPPPPQSVRRSQTLRQRAGQYCKRHQGDIQTLCSRMFCALLCVPSSASRSIPAIWTGARDRGHSSLSIWNTLKSQQSRAAWVTYWLLII